MSLPRRLSLLLAALGVSFAAPPAGGQPPRSSQEAFRGVAQGDILPLNVIRQRVHIPGAQLIGIDFSGSVYRLRFMKGSDTAIVLVDARSGRQISCTATNRDMCR